MINQHDGTGLRPKIKTRKLSGIFVATNSSPGGNERNGAINIVG